MPQLSPLLDDKKTRRLAGLSFFQRSRSLLLLRLAGRLVGARLAVALLLLLRVALGLLRIRRRLLLFGRRRRIIGSIGHGIEPFKRDFSTNAVLNGAMVAGGDNKAPRRQSAGIFSIAALIQHSCAARRRGRRSQVEAKSCAAPSRRSPIISPGRCRRPSTTRRFWMRSARR